MPRHFGGGQWYFLCSALNRPARVLWRPRGALFFRCRQYWGRKAAYLSQFSNELDRAHMGRAKLKAKLCSPKATATWTMPPAGWILASQGRRLYPGCSWLPAFSIDIDCFRACLSAGCPGTLSR
jgi:hypothetical protein